MIGAGGQLTIKKKTSVIERPDGELKPLGGAAPPVFILPSHLNRIPGTMGPGSDCTLPGSGPPDPELTRRQENRVNLTSSFVFSSHKLSTTLNAFFSH
ncbi:hypothetical protein ElyMa_005175900 [Elysia marginata]|uniref:Uncharacterized protein n=1 Tax=Elysia marginata TaxID=1093978 RepID=A0AAV4JSS6_9GAST|nr:hypothetical protein ElyMa_005175900 [Elysia marginata]